MSNSGGSNGSAMTMSGANARSGAPDLGREFGSALSAAELNARQHYVTPGSGDGGAYGQQENNMLMSNTEREARNIPHWVGQYQGPPVPYAAPSAQKERFLLKSAIRDAASREIQESAQGRGAPGVIRTDPIGEDEVNYLQSMKDMAELAKFDQYVESLIDPRQPGNMKWLMEVYPDYVNRRLQQAHTDYEYALRNQMIDQWGINTFDDLHFKYMVDQGKLAGPALMDPRPRVDDRYTPGWLSPYNFQSPFKGGTRMGLPYASAKHGRRPAAPGPGGTWSVDRSEQPLGQGNSEQALARGMYNGAPPSRVMPTFGPDFGTAITAASGARESPFAP